MDYALYVCVCVRACQMQWTNTTWRCVCEYVWIITCSPGLSTKRICPIITFINAREWAMCTMYRVHYGTAVLLYCFNTCCALCTNNIDKNGRLLALCSRRTSSSPLPSHSPSQKSALWLIIILWVSSKYRRVFSCLQIIKIRLIFGEFPHREKS